MEKAKSFHLIIDIERLKDDSYVRGLEHYYGAPGLSHGIKQPMFCDAESKAANTANPLNISKITLKRLRDLNQADLSLHHELVGHCDPNGVQFPQMSLADLFPQTKHTT